MDYEKFLTPHVLELMLIEQEIVQGKRDPDVFIDDVTSDKDSGGFNWFSARYIELNRGIVNTPGAEPILKEKIEEYPEEYQSMTLVEDLGIFAIYKNSEGQEILVSNQEIFKFNFYNHLERGTA